MAKAKAHKGKKKAVGAGFSHATLIRLAQIGAAQVMREFQGQMGEVEAFLKQHPIEIAGAATSAKVTVAAKPSGPSSAQKAKAAAGLKLYQSAVKVAGGQKAWKALSKDEQSALKGKIQSGEINPADYETKDASAEASADTGSAPAAEGLDPEVAAALQS